MPRIQGPSAQPYLQRPEHGDLHPRPARRPHHRARRLRTGTATGHDQAAVEGVDDGGGPVAQPELHEDPSQVPGHDVLGDGESGGDLVVPQTAADRVEHLALLPSQGCGGRPHGS